jgi:7-cyano-7-deazaguanine synthase
MEKHDLVILLSGGHDSVLLLNVAKQMAFSPLALLIGYGQKHIAELEKAKFWCEKLEVPFRKMTVDLAGVNSGLTGDLEGGIYRDVHVAHVPGRNILFIGLAMSLAESVGATKIWYGANYEDRINQFPDCSQEFVYSMNQSTIRAGSYPIELEAPLLGMRKDTIQRWAKLFGIDENEVHSGYDV